MVSNTDKTITVLGTGYVGLTTAVLLAEVGYKVYAVDINKDRLKTIAKGRSFFYEAGINPLIAHCVKAGNLIPTSSYKESVPISSIVFSCVGTPDNPDGSTNLTWAFAAAEEASKYMKDGTTFVQKSTVPAGTGKKIEDVFKKHDKNVTYISNPEFLREGTAIIDSLWFDRIVVGGRSKSAKNKIVELYKKIERNRDEIAARAGLQPPANFNGQYFTTNRNSAELIKVAANAFLALKISFANSIAKLADHSGADINEVMDVVGADRRIGRAFLNAGRGYGGGCFPKDVSGLISSAREHGVELAIMTAATDLNASMPGYIANKSKAALGTLDSKKLAVLGLAYKAGTSDARLSPGVKLANNLSFGNAKIRAYDPQANEEAQKNLRRGIEVCRSIEETIRGVDAVFIATDWPEFLAYDLKKMAKLMKGKLFVDCMNVFEIDEVEEAGLKYTGVGR